MVPMKLRTKEGKEITLFAVTDVSTPQGGYYSYHIVDELGKIQVIGLEAIKSYQFVSFVDT